MSRARPVETLLAALAVLGVSLPLVTLFTPASGWFRPTVILVALVALVGMGLRSLTSSRALVVVGQVVLLAHGASVLHGQGHLWRNIVPVPDTGAALGVLLTEAYETVTSYTAPAPSNRGTVLAVSLLIGITAVAVDAIGVTYRSPALAGVPLLSAFLASATNSGDGLGAWYAVPGALAWLALVGRQGVRSLRSWGTTAPHSSTGPSADPTSAFVAVGRVVGVTALAVAVVLPGLIPHFPTTFLADGLGRSANGRGGTGSDVRLASSIDIARDLGSRSDAPVLRFSTTTDDFQPLRVGVLDTYRRGVWRARQDYTFVPVDGQIPGPVAGPEVPRRVERITVSANGIGVPQVALPPGVIGSPFPGGTWNMTSEGVVQLTQPVGSYTAEFVELDPTEAQFASDRDSADARDLRLDEGSEQEVRALLDQITEEGDTPLQIARAIQAHLRSAPYSYSLDLVDEAADGSLSSDSLARFLETKRGYCVQFSTAMIMLSRAAGIPARMASGFLPGVPDGDERVVRVSDAHAWPELWFPQLGWVRFEPTPATRSGSAPAYSLVPTETGGSSAPVPSGSATSSAFPTVGPTRDLGDLGADSTTDTGGVDVVRFTSEHAITIGVVLLAVLAVAVVPVGAWLARRRARRDARDDADRIEAEWQSLLLRLGDIGVVPSDGATPREASRQVGRSAYLTEDESAALGRVVATLERARYARPGADLTDVADDARTVWRGALSRRRRTDRLRALLLPEEGRRLWRGSLRRLVPTRRRNAPPPPKDH
jgi:transglutaminase-like putative cysteine protease